MTCLGGPLNLIRTDFWFQDGNIVLIAQNAAFKVHKGQLARHSEVFNDLFSLPQPSRLDDDDDDDAGNGNNNLAAAVGGSSGTLGDSSDLIDGCPFVVLQDSPADVFYFLSALYDGLHSKSRSRPYPYSPTFASLSAVLRLASKYFVEPLVRQCYFHLSLDWPVSLSGWDNREARFTLDPPSFYAISSSSGTTTTTNSKNLGRRCQAGRYVPREFCPHPVLIIQFALEMNLPAILPAAMYDLSRYGLNKILNGTNPSCTTFDRLVAQYTAALEKPKPLRLSREMFCQILRGREETQRFLASFIERELYCRTPSLSCQSVSPFPVIIHEPQRAHPEPSSSFPPQLSHHHHHHHPCAYSFYLVHLNVLRSIAGITFGRDADVLFTLTQASEMLDRTDFHVATSDRPTTTVTSVDPSTTAGEMGSITTGAAAGYQKKGGVGLNLCQSCKFEFRESVKRAREELWSCLPRWFGLTEPETQV